MRGIECVKLTKCMRGTQTGIVDSTTPDSVRLADPMAVMTRLPRGATVILRHYDAPDRTGLARRLLALCRRRRVMLLIAGDARLAAMVGADGLHLPEDQLRRGGCRWRLWRKPRWRVTAAAHGKAALVRAARAGVDAVLLSPVFPTRSHPGAPVLGPLRFESLRRTSPVPVIALGGIDPATVRRIRGGTVAGIGGILGLVAVHRHCYIHPR